MLPQVPPGRTKRAAAQRCLHLGLRIEARWTPEEDAMLPQVPPGRTQRAAQVRCYRIGVAWPRSGSWTPAREALLRRLLSEGRRHSYIASELGISVWTLRDKLRKS